MAWGGEIISPTASIAYWNTQALTVGTPVVDAGLARVGCNRAEIVYARTVPAGYFDDVATINLHIGKTAGPLVSTFLLAGDLDAAKADLLIFITALNSTMSSGFTCREIRWYQTRDDLHLSGPAIRVDSVGLTGAATAARVPDQIAMSATIATSSRKHWGRVYVPGVKNINIDTTYGRFTNAQVINMASWMQILNNNLTLHGFDLGVWSPTAKSFLKPRSVRCDDIPDVIRSRRQKMVAFRQTYTS